MPAVFTLFTRLLTIAFFLLLCACTKNSGSDQEKIYSGTYESENKAYLDKPVLYAAGKKIEDTKFIEDFLNRINYNGTGFVFNQTTESLPDHFKDVSFIDRNHVALYGNGGFKNGVIVSESGNEILIENIDTVNFTYPSYPNPGRCEIMEQALAATKPIRICSTPMPLYISCQVIQRVSLTPDKGKLVLKFMSYLATNYDDIYRRACSFGYANFWNSFDKNSLSQLSTNDTIVIQTKKVYLSK